MSTASQPVSVTDHLARILAVTSRLGDEEVPLATATGRRLATDMVARAPVPPWDNSAMDGYAVRADDVAQASPDHPVTLDVVADLPAGSDQDPSLDHGQAVRIMTGAVVPSQADTVVRSEDTDQPTMDRATPRTVTVLRAPALGMHVRHRGEDRRVGETVAAAGTLVRPVVAAALAATGYGTNPVVRSPRVAVITTGSELVRPGVPLRRGQTPDSNTLLISGLAREAGAAIVAVRQLSDEQTGLATILAELDSCDAVIVTGGVGPGAYDPIRGLFGSSSEITVGTVAMEPGKPQAFGRLPSGALLFGLPGNPVGAWVSFQVFVRPALLMMQGAEVSALCPTLRARAGADWSRTKHTDRTQYLPAWTDREDAGTADTGWVTYPITPRGSHRVATLARANSMVVMPVGQTWVHRGDLVDVVVDNADDVLTAEASATALAVATAS